MQLRKTRVWTWGVEIGGESARARAPYLHKLRDVLVDDRAAAHQDLHRAVRQHAAGQHLDLFVCHNSTRFQGVGRAMFERLGLDRGFGVEEQCMGAALE